MLLSKSKSSATIFAVLAAMTVGLTVLSRFQAQESNEPKDFVRLPNEVPAPKDNATTPEKFSLGKQLFFDPRLSGNNKVSCATCHVPEKGFADGLPQAKGMDGNTLKRNTPSLLNVGFYRGYFWDGRAKTLEEASLLPIQDLDEMSQKLDDLERKLNAVPGYVKQFQAVFGTGVNRQGIGKALAAFQRTLVTKDSPFDRYLAGDKNALPDEAKRGMELFVGAAGCVRCHKGPLLSDDRFYRLMVTEDKGRGEMTGKSTDNYKFRTPSLRSVSKTGPYMHDGSMATLEQVVTFYYRNAPVSGPDGLSLDIEPLLGQSFSEIGPIVAFLEALSGEEPKIHPPKLP